MLRSIIIGLALLASGTAAAQEAPSLPEWMAGAWCTEVPPSDRTCEFWSPDSGGLMLGGSVTTKGGKAVEFEQLRIAPHEGGIAYFASPGGKGPIVFRSVEVGDRSVTFGKPDHDYPQRIRYWRDGEAMVAEISLTDGSKPMRWRYLRVK
jgi:hypothetical protein